MGGPSCITVLSIVLVELREREGGRERGRERGREGEGGRGREREGERGRERGREGEGEGGVDKIFPQHTTIGCPILTTHQLKG